MIGLVIPAYNAEATIGRAVAGGRRHVDAALVVDDGSGDGTGKRAVEAGAEVVRHPRNLGKGAALRTGFARMRAIGAGAVITMDADLQHDPEDIPRFIQAHRQRGADLIVGSRASHFGLMSPGRRTGNRFSCGALRFFTGLELPDSQSGFRLYGRDFLAGLVLRRDAYDAEMEALLVAARERRRIEALPIAVPAADGKTTSFYRPWLDTYRICRTVILFSVCEL
ncbi:MAG TPA: glycosyltransferase family 2 protein [Candidatus Polarisedimenticolia bacterium]|nr:glycosyltransferase family 2 protein [Candidatus Polarisedimenticolia bacterium]